MYRIDFYTRVLVDIKKHTNRTTEKCDCSLKYTLQLAFVCGIIEPVHQPPAPSAAQ